MAITLVKAKKPYKHKIGDILFGNEYLENINLEDLKKKKYVYAFSNRRLNSELKKEFFEYFKYECPFIDGNRYFWFYPSFVFTDTPDEKDIMHQFMEDDNGGWRADKLKEIEEFDEYSIHNQFWAEKFYMGHGYTSYTLPSDGSNNKDVVMVRLNNDDILVGQTWVWFNK